MLNRNDFFDSGIWWRGKKPYATVISRAPPHMEAITSNGVLRQFPQSKRNHWNSYPCLFLSSVLLLLAEACSSAPSSCLISIIISFSAAVPRSWLDTVKVLFQISRQKCPCGEVYLTGIDFHIPFSATAELIIMPCLFKSLLFVSSLDFFVGLIYFNFH